MPSPEKDPIGWGVQTMVLRSALYHYAAAPLRVIDGDTYDFDIDLGLDIYTRETVRLYGFNTPEIFGAKATPEGQRAKAFADLWLRDQRPAGPYADCIIRSMVYNPREKYGRLLVSVYRARDGASLGDDLYAAGLAVRY